MIKLCGIRRFEDIEYMNEALPDYIGFILAEGFRRTVDISLAGKLSERLDSRVKRVAVFVDTPIEKVREAIDTVHPDVLQLHGNEDKSYISKAREFGIPLWKAVRVRTREDIEHAESSGCDMLLLDSFVKGKAGGTGVTLDLDIVRTGKIATPFFIAGGLTAENLPEALSVSPNVDISGGAETDGVKDREKILRLMEIYRQEARKA